MTKALNVGKIEHLLTVLELTDKHGRREDSDKSHMLPLKHFTGAEPLLEEFIDYGGGDEPKFFGDVTPRDVDNKWDVSILCLPGEDDDGKTQPIYQLSRFRNLPLSAARGRKIYSSILCENAIAHLYPDNYYLPARILAWYVHGAWRAENRAFLDTRIEGHAASIERRSGLIDDGFDRQVRVALGMQFTRFYEWRVALGYEDGIQLSFVTDPIGAREVFRLRDAPPGASRRAALRNWVAEHWRKLRNEPEEETKVRRHLRGATEFAWNGLHCRISPSESDVQINEKLRLERERQRRFY